MSKALATKNIAAFLLGIAMLLSVFAFATPASTSTTFEVDTTAETYRLQPLLSATTTNATSTNTGSNGGFLVIAGASKVVFEFSRGGATNPNTGATRFTVQVTQDGVTWKDFNRLVGNDVSGTATSSVTISAATSTVTVGLNLDYETYYAARCVAREFTDGEHTCAAAAEY